MCMSVLSSGVCMCNMCTRCLKSYRQLSVVIGLLGIEPGASGRTGLALNNQVVSPVPVCLCEARALHIAGKRAVLIDGEAVSFACLSSITDLKLLLSRLPGAYTALGLLGVRLHLRTALSSRKMAPAAPTDTAF